MRKKIRKWKLVWFLRLARQLKGVYTHSHSPISFRHEIPLIIGKSIHHSKSLLSCNSNRNLSFPTINLHICKYLTGAEQQPRHQCVLIIPFRLYNIVVNDEVKMKYNLLSTYLEIRYVLIWIKWKLSMTLKWFFCSLEIAFDGKFKKIYNKKIKNFTIEIRNTLIQHRNESIHDKRTISSRIMQYWT